MLSTNTGDEVKMMIDHLTHIADVKVGRVKGNSRWYPQLRLPSQYAHLVGQRASVYEASGSEGDIAVVIYFGVNKNQMADSRVSKLEEVYETRKLEMPSKPCGGYDSGSNPDSGALFEILLMI